MSFSPNRYAQKLRQAMRDRKITTPELAAVLRLSPRTIENIAAANSMSRNARQRISDYLAVQIWPDIQPQTTATTIPESTVFLRLNEKQAESLHASFSNSTRVVRMTDSPNGPFGVEFTADTPAIISCKNPAGLPAPASETK